MANINNNITKAELLASGYTCNQWQDSDQPKSKVKDLLFESHIKNIEGLATIDVCWGYKNNDLFELSANIGFADIDLSIKKFDFAKIKKIEALLKELKQLINK